MASPRKALTFLPLLLASCSPNEAEGDDEGNIDDFCGIQQTGPDAPWFNLRQNGETLSDGAPLTLVCGWQGAFMIETSPILGGFMPASDEVQFHLSLDVEGFNIGPNGHFAEASTGLFVGCCDDDYGCYYETTTLIVFPPDGIDDMTALHGLPAMLNITMDIPEGPVEETLELELWAVPDEMWAICGYGDYQPLEPMPASGDIPLSL